MDIERMTTLLREVRARLDDGRITRQAFDMGMVTNDCNTCECIGGWALIIDAQQRGVPISKIPTHDLLDPAPAFGNGLERQLYALFFKYPENIDDRRITPEMGVQAIDAFLSGREGNPWDYVL